VQAQEQDQKQAQEQEQAQEQLATAAAAATATMDHLGDPPSKSGIGWIYNAIASGFRGTKSSIRSRPSLLSSDDDCDQR
jgi:hypothetical protein